MSDTLPVARSLHNPTADTAAERRVVADRTTTHAAPTGATKGHRVRHHRFLRVLLQSVGGTGFSLTLWGKDDVSGQWAIVTSFGTAGILAVTTAAPNTARSTPVVIAGLDELYFQVSTITGATANVWASGCTF